MARMGYCGKSKNICCSAETPSGPSKNAHGVPCSLRVAVAFVIIIGIFFFSVVVLFIVFLVGLFSKEDIGICRPISRVRLGAFLRHSAHAHIVTATPGEKSPIGE